MTNSYIQYEYVRILYFHFKKKVLKCILYRVRSYHILKIYDKREQNNFSTVRYFINKRISLKKIL